MDWERFFFTGMAAALLVLLSVVGLALLALLGAYVIAFFMLLGPIKWYIVLGGAIWIVVWFALYNDPRN